MGPQERLALVPQLKNIARLESEEFSRVASGDVTPPMLLGVAKKVNQVFANEPQVAGVVVTIGSNSMEELAYFLDLSVKSDKPVVLTAAQRLMDDLSSDGAINLFDAVRVAASPQSKGKGVLVVTNNEIQAARDVRKTISHRVEAWNSGDMGVLGLVDWDRINWYRLPVRRHTTQSEFDISAVKELPNIYISYSYTGANGVGVQAEVEKGKAQGIVLAGFPTGGCAPEQCDELFKLAKNGMIVVDSSRGGRGRPAKRYPEFVDGDTLTPQHARILLMLALTRTHDMKEIQRIFEEY